MDITMIILHNIMEYCSTVVGGGGGGARTTIATPYMVLVLKYNYRLSPTGGPCSRRRTENGFAVIFTAVIFRRPIWPCLRAHS